MATTDRYPELTAIIADLLRREKDRIERERLAAYAPGPDLFGVRGVRSIDVDSVRRSEAWPRDLATFGDLGGVEIRESPFLVVPDPDSTLEDAWYADWRSRLARNLGRPSTGRWESLTFARVRMIPDPNVYRMAVPGAYGFHFCGASRQVLLAHPATIARLQRALRSAGTARAKAVRLPLDA